VAPEAARRDRPGMTAHWAGVDVGADKGFDGAVIDGSGLVAGPQRIVGIPETVQWLLEQRPRVIAVDSPRAPAPPGQLSRPDERALVRARICGIRYTPHAAALAKNESYYGWITNGIRLYAALVAERAPTRCEVIECFPTATWTRLGGRRGKRSRARWSGQVLDSVDLQSVPSRLNQDARDAIGAALTAKLYDEGMTERFGEIIVPLARIDLRLAQGPDSPARTC
jgi:predicted nuclease with RNAse H fold